MRVLPLLFLLWLIIPRANANPQFANCESLLGSLEKPAGSLSTGQVLDPRHSLFEKLYLDSYIPGKCGINILTFFKRLESEGLEIQGLSLVYLENKGFSVFGMVNAEKARAQINGTLKSEEKNWYHHIFAIDRNGMVYDFDYTESPKPTPFRKYIEDMYLNENECLNPKAAEFCAGRKDKLADYQLKLFDAKDALEGVERAQWEGSLGQAMDKFK